jgi:hypothetical protein
LYDENDVEYGILEESAALRAANSANGVGVADVRSVRRQVYLHDDDDEPEDVGLLVADASPLFHRRREDLIEHLSTTSLPIYNSNNNN